MEDDATDRRVRRTKRALRDALQSLIEEKGYNAVTVQDILDRADVGRSTFYAHYRDKEDLLLKGFDDIRAALRSPAHQAAKSDRTRQDLLVATLPVFTHVEAYRRTWKPLVRKGGADVVTRMLRDAAEDSIRTQLQAQAPTAGERVEPATQFLAGGLMGLLTWWLDSGNAVNAEEVHAMFRHLSEPGVKRFLSQ